MKIDSESPLLTEREREFLRRIALKLQADVQRRWRDLPSGHKELVEAVFGKGR